MYIKEHINISMLVFCLYIQQKWILEIPKKNEILRIQSGEAKIYLINEYGISLRVLILFIDMQGNEIMS